MLLVKSPGWSCSQALAPYGPVFWAQRLGRTVTGRCLELGRDRRWRGWLLPPLDHPLSPTLPLGWAELALVPALGKMQFLSSEPSPSQLTFPRFFIQGNMVPAADEVVIGTVGARGGLT